MFNDGKINTCINRNREKAVRPVYINEKTFSFDEHCTKNEVFH